jgi:hypothetical protein
MPQCPVPLAKASLFTVFDSGGRLPRGVLRGPLPVYLAQNSLVNAGPQEHACPSPCSLSALTYAPQGSYAAPFMTRNVRSLPNLKLH